MYYYIAITSSQQPALFYKSLRVELYFYTTFWFIKLQLTLSKLVPLSNAAMSTEEGISTEVEESMEHWFEKGLVVYKGLKEDMQKALGFKEYAEQLSHITLTLKSVNKHLDAEERAIVDKLDKAYELAQEGLEKATVVVTVIKEQSSALLLALSDATPGEDHQKMFTACLYFSAFAKVTEARVREAQDILRKASIALFNSLNDIRSIIKTLKRVHNQFIQAKRAAQARARTGAYLGALAGLIAGPCGLIISYSIAVGITEGLTIPQIEADFAQQRRTMARYISGFENMYTETEELQEEIDTKRNQLIEIQAKLSTAGTITAMTEDVIVGALRKIHFSNVRQYVEGLVKACEEFLDTSK